MTVPPQPTRLVINRATRDVVLDGKAVRLTRLEFELLSYLADHAYKVLTKAEIGQEVWGYSDGSSNRAIESHFNRIRRKLNGFDPIVTKWGVGYMYAPEGKDSEQARDAALAAMDIAILVTRPDAQIAWVSDSVSEFLGVPADELLGSGYYDLVHPSDRTRALARTGILEAGETTRLTYRVGTASGDYRDVRVTSTPMRDDDDQLLGVIHEWSVPVV